MKNVPTALTRVFVYGTLVRGEANHRVLGGARLVADATTSPAFELYDLGYFPALVAGGDQVVWGELYDVDLPTLERLDELEGHPRAYRRRAITLSDGTNAQAYLLPRPKVVGRPRILSGNWPLYRKEKS